MKSLKPSMRERKRYLYVKGSNPKENVLPIVKEFLGVFGLAKTNLTWIKFGKDWGIICIDRDMLDSVRASFAICEKDLRVERVSGTLKGLKKK